MVNTELAEASIAYHLGELAATAIFPIAGLVLLIVGLRQQSRARRPPPGSPPPAPHPYGPSPNPAEPGPPPPPEYYPSPPPAPRPSRSSIALIVVGAILLAGSMLAIISGAANLRRQSVIASEAPNVGQCIAANNLRGDAKTLKTQDCAAPDSTFEVVTKGGPAQKCPDGKTDDSDYAFVRDGPTTLCFMLNFVQGRCYTTTGDQHFPVFTPIDCDDSAPRFKITSRVDGGSDTGSCPAGTKKIAYQNPVRRYCLQPLAR